MTEVCDVAFTDHFVGFNSSGITFQYLGEIQINVKNTNLKIQIKVIYSYEMAYVEIFKQLLLFKLYI